MFRGDRLFCFVLSANLLLGCQSIPPGSSLAQPEIIPPAESSIPESHNATRNNKGDDGIDVSASISKAIQHLGSGDVKKAKIHLNIVVAEHPNNDNANDFLKQIYTDPNRYFGKEHFTYKARRGDSMTRIAEKFLKDHLKFYILSRYSGIDDPSSLVMGQEVRIPIKYKPTLKQDKREGKLEKEARKLLGQEKYLDAIKLIEAEKQTTKYNNVHKNILSEAYILESERIEVDKDYQRALEFLKKAHALSKNPSLLVNRLAKLDNLHRATRYRRLAVAHEKSGQYAIAFKNINECFELMPNEAEVALIRKRIQQKLVNSYHVEALRFYERKQLTKAISFWDKVLDLAPSNEDAETYRNRSIAMQKNLAALNPKM